MSRQLKLKYVIIWHRICLVLFVVDFSSDEIVKKVRSLKNSVTIEIILDKVHRQLVEETFLIEDGMLYSQLLD